MKHGTQNGWLPDSPSPLRVVFPALIGILSLFLVSCHDDPPLPDVSQPYQSPGINLPESVMHWITPPWERDAEQAPANVIRVPQDEPTIQRAIDRANTGDNVVVSPGRYVENLHFRGKAIVVRSTDGPQRTIIDGGGSSSTVIFVSGEGNGSVLTGFRIVNGIGMTDPSYDKPHRQGGGIYVRGSSPVIAWNIIEENHGENGGGILCHDSASPVISNNLIRGNTAHKGAGIRISGSSPLIVNCVIVGNHASRLGGGIYWRVASLPYIVNNTIVNNRADEFGGGVFCSNVPSAGRWVVLANNVIVGNRAPQGSSITINLTPTRIKLIANVIEGGREEIFYKAPGVSAHWDASNIADDGAIGLDRWRPTRQFPGIGMADPAWIGGITHDFLGNPRPNPASGGGASPTIGAVEYSTENIQDDHWFEETQR